MSPSLCAKLTVDSGDFSGNSTFHLLSLGVVGIQWVLWYFSGMIAAMVYHDSSVAEHYVRRKLFNPLNLACLAIRLCMPIWQTASCLEFDANLMWWMRYSPFMPVLVIWRVMQLYWVMLTHCSALHYPPIVIYLFGVF